MYADNGVALTMRAAKVWNGDIGYIDERRSEIEAELVAALFHRNGLGKIPRLIHIAATSYGDVVGEELQRHDLQNR